MVDIGWPELFIIAVIALIVIGPKDLPKALQTVGRWVRAVRKVSGEFQRHVDDMVRESELDEVRKGLNQATSYNVGREIEKAVDPDGAIKKEMTAIDREASAQPKLDPPGAAPGDDGAGKAPATPTNGGDASAADTSVESAPPASVTTKREPETAGPSA